MFGKRLFQERTSLALLICGHIALCCVSLVLVAPPQPFVPQTFHILFDPARLHLAVLAAAAFGLVAVIFVVARFSFGYFAGFYLYTMVLGHLWLGCFSDLAYDHWTAGWSTAASAVAFLLPALLITSPLRQRYVPSLSAFDWLLHAILLISVLTIAVAASYDFSLAGFSDIYGFRRSLQSPAPVNYMIGITSGALLPFAFACYVLRRAYWQSAAILVLLLLYYPITLSKLAFFTPAWLVFLAILSKFFAARTAVVLSLLGPIFAGVVLMLMFGEAAIPYFSPVNFRMIAIPSTALDIYSDFFSRHDPTYFCQISILKKLMSCPYQDQLAIVMLNNYHLGNFNASLFATEGIASLGTTLAPISVFFCGLVFALGNRLSEGLPARFVLVSSGVLPQVLLNVPLSTTLLTHGAAFLFLLWYLTPRGMFEAEIPGERGARQIAAAA